MPQVDNNAYHYKNFCVIAKAVRIKKYKAFIFEFSFILTYENYKLQF